MPELGEVVPGILHLSRLAVFANHPPDRTIGWAMVPIPCALSAAAVEVRMATKVLRNGAHPLVMPPFTLDGIPSVDTFLIWEGGLTQDIVGEMIGHSDVRS